jgi:outer membrane immunogenic protein
LNPRHLSADAANSCETGVLWAKDANPREQKAVVATASQLRTITAPALPRSNQIQATLFDEGHNGNNGDPVMKRVLLGTAAFIAFAAPAFAADLPPRTYNKAPVYTAPAVVYNWTGFYIGGHVGGAFAGDSSLQGSDARFLGGVQGGFDYQFAPNWVMGIEAQYSWLGGNNDNGVTFPGGTLITANSDQLGSVTGRLGYTWGPALLYAKGGYAWRDNNNIGVSLGGAPVAFATDGNRKDGFTVGAGLEYMFAPNWSAKAEYQYYNFGNTTFTAGTPEIVGARFRDDEHTVKAGINYRFGWGGPVASKY